MKNNLPPVACQLTHPDAFFYDIQVSENLIYGFFEAHEKGQSFHVATKVFLNCACELGYIADYDESVQRVYISDNFEGTDHPALAWVCDLIEANRDATQAILKAAVEFEFEAELTRLAREAASGLVSSSVSKRIYRNVDADFCDAIKAISRIIEAVEVYEEEVEAANPQDYFTCKACNCKVPIEYQVRTQGFCYLCDPNISVEELEAANA